MHHRGKSSQKNGNTNRIIYWLFGNWFFHTAISPVDIRALFVLWLCTFYVCIKYTHSIVHSSYYWVGRVCLWIMSIWTMSTNLIELVPGMLVVELPSITPPMLNNTVRKSHWYESVWHFCSENVSTEELKTIGWSHNV